MLRHSLVAVMVSMLCSGLAGPVAASGAEGLERVTQTLVAPPFLPPHDQTATGPPKVVQVRLVVEEKLVAVGPARSSGRSPSTGACPVPSSWCTRETTWSSRW